MNGRDVCVKGLLLTFVLGWFSPIHAARLEATVTPQHPALGEHFSLHIVAVTDPGETVQPPAWTTTLGPFDVVATTSTPFTQGKPSPEQSFTLTLALFDINTSTIPALSFQVSNSSGTQTLSTPEIPVTPRSVLPKNTRDIRDIKGRIGVSPWLWLLLGVLVALGLGLWVWQRKRHPLSLGPPPPPPVPPEVEAEEALLRLSEDLAGPAKLFYSQLSNIARKYLERRFQVPALDRTTSEITAALKAAHFSGELRQAVKDTLASCDLAKFAKADPPPPIRREDVERVRHLVQSTRQPSGMNP